LPSNLAHSHMHSPHIHSHTMQHQQPNQGQGQQHSHLSSVPPQLSPHQQNQNKILVPQQGKKGGGGGMTNSPQMHGGGSSLNRTGPTPPHSPQDNSVMPMAPGFLPTVQIDDPVKLRSTQGNIADSLRGAQRAAQRYAPPSSSQHRPSDLQPMPNPSTGAPIAVTAMPGGQPMPNKGPGPGPKPPPPQQSPSQQGRRLHLSEEVHGRPPVPGVPAPNAHQGMLGLMPGVHQPMAPNPMQQQHRASMGDVSISNPRPGGQKTAKGGGRQGRNKMDGM